MATGVQAQQASKYESPRTVLRDDIRYDVRADGTYVVEEIESLRINNEIGVKSFAQISLPFSASLQELEILEAYTTTKDGKRIDVAADKIFTQQSPLSAQAPMFDDVKIKNIVFPAVEVGATIAFHLKRTQKTALFPGAFSMMEVFDKSTEFKSAQVTVVAPASLKLFVDAVDLKGGEIKSDKPNMKMWRWVIADTVAHAPEIGSVSASDYSPRITVTSFANANDAAKAYLSRAASKARVTPMVQKLADDATKGITDKRAQAKALYEWVSMNIRYVAIFLDFGGVVPHDADAIIEAKYGDCKDHVTLLEALLAAKQIKSSSVLVNASNSYWFPKVAALPGIMNHVITYVPEFDLYLDSTAQFAPFGVLPPNVIGKSALRLNEVGGQATVVLLPEAQAGFKNAIRVNTKLDISAAGEVSGQSQIASVGVFEFIARAISSSIPKGMEPQVASQVLSMTGQQGKGSYTFGDGRNLHQEFAYATNFVLSNYAQLPGPGALSVPTGLGSLTDILGTVQSAALEKRDFNKQCGGSLREETTTITLPAAMKEATLPQPLKIETDFGRYESSYVATNQIITVKRILDLKMPAVCNVEDYAKFRTFAGAIARDLRAQILY